MRGIAFRIVRIKQRYPLFSHAQQQPFVKITHHIKASIPTKGKLSFQPEIPTRKAGICGQKTPCADLADQAQNKPEQHQQGYQNSNSLKIGSPGECSASEDSARCASTAGVVIKGVPSSRISPPLLGGISLFMFSPVA